jgi:presenilin-like A22 family membrane protease
LCGFYAAGSMLRVLRCGAALSAQPLDLGNTTHPRTSMIDIVYILATVAFFALMLLYVRACERLGRDTTDKTERTP